MGLCSFGWVVDLAEPSYSLKFFSFFFSAPRRLLRGLTQRLHRSPRPAFMQLLQLVVGVASHWDDGQYLQTGLS